MEVKLGGINIVNILELVEGWLIVPHVGLLQRELDSGFVRNETGVGHRVQIQIRQARDFPVVFIVIDVSPDSIRANSRAVGNRWWGLGLDLAAEATESVLSDNAILTIQGSYDVRVFEAKTSHC